MTAYSPPLYRRDGISNCLYRVFYVKKMILYRKGYNIFFICLYLYSLLYSLLYWRVIGTRETHP